MARKQETYGLPDETLQLIASSPDFGFLLPQQGTTAQFATPDVRRSDLISALRNISGPANPGFTRYANKANAPALNVNLRNTRGAMSPVKLAMQKYVAPEVVLPGGDTQVPYTPPTTPVVPDVIVPDLDPVIPDPVIPDPVDPDPVVPDPVVPDPVYPDPVDPLPSIYTKPIVSDIPDDIDPDEIPLIPAPDILETIPSIYTKEIKSSIPDEIDPSTIPLIIPDFPLDLPEIPEVPDRTGIVEMYPGDTVIPEVVGPKKGGGGDLPEEFDKYLVDEILNSLSFGGGGGAVGGGKPFDDTYGNILEM